MILGLGYRCDLKDDDRFQAGEHGDCQQDELEIPVYLHRPSPDLPRKS